MTSSSLSSNNKYRVFDQIGWFNTHVGFVFWYKPMSRSSIVCIVFKNGFSYFNYFRYSNVESCFEKWNENDTNARKLIEL